MIRNAVGRKLIVLYLSRPDGFLRTHEGITLVAVAGAIARLKHYRLPAAGTSHIAAPLHSKLRVVAEVAGESVQGEPANNSTLLGMIWQPSSRNVYWDVAGGAGSLEAHRTGKSRPVSPSASACRLADRSREVSASGDTLRSVTSRPTACRVGILVLLVVATLIVVQPLGVFWHFVHDHLGEHSGVTHVAAAIHLEDADAPDHGADHCHVWMTPADTVILPGVDRPHVVAVVTVFEHVSGPTAPLFPPFSPPRA